MAATLSAACAATALGGLAIVTNPAPARNAPRAASLAAPVEGNSPETTTAWPLLYLWPETLGFGNSASQSGGSLAHCCGLISSRTEAGIPMSATISFPQ